MTTTRWAVRLRSKHTGNVVNLGSTYATQEEAQLAGEQECMRCNSLDVIPVQAEENGLNPLAFPQRTNPNRTDRWIKPLPPR